MDEEAFDVDAFCETLFAYMPSTEVISPEEITEWMFTLAKDHREKRRQEGKIQLNLKSVIEETANKGRKISESSLQSTEDLTSTTSSEKKRNGRMSESSDYSDIDTDDFKLLVNQLMEMFPSACALEVGHCLTLMSGNVESAAQLIMHRQESGQSLKPADYKNRIKGTQRQGKEVDEKTMKEIIMNKYGYVDQAEDGRYHRPTLKREVSRFCQIWYENDNICSISFSSNQDDKKMIRYRDGKIVSTKGERYTQVTKAESEEMKKSYVNNS